MITSRRLTLAAAVLAALAAVALIVVIVRGGDVNTGPIGESAAAGDPHAPVECSPQELRRILNAVEAISQSSDQAELAAVGRELFRSNALAKQGESCQGCHTDGGSNADIGTTPHDPAGVNIATDFLGLRDPPSLYGVKDTAPYFWNGNVATLKQVAFDTVANHFLDGVDGTIDAAGMTTENAAAALEAYMNTFEAPEGDFSQGTLSASARRGMVLFQQKGGCIGCHFGPDLTDNRLHDILVPQVTVPAAMGGGPADDPGALRPPATLNGGKCPLSPLTNVVPITIDPRTCAINTPSIRGVGRTGPFMHNGVFTTLQQVVDFYNGQSIIAPLNLTAAEMADLVDFLRAL